MDDDNTPMITLKLDMPQWLFCTATGRTWLRDAPAAPAQDAPGEAPGGVGNIVALLARAG